MRSGRKETDNNGQFDRAMIITKIGTFEDYFTE